MTLRTLAILTAALAIAGPTFAQSAADDVVVVVNVPTPPGVTAERLRTEFEAAAPRYRQILGLKTKSFTIGEGSFGGAYLFEDRASAEAWFSDAWRQRVVQTYGAPARVDIYEAPLTIDGPAAE
jgi:hypothetical protein